MATSKLFVRLGILWVLSAMLPAWGQNLDALSPAARALLPTCNACHGADGNASLPTMPRLAAQPRVFIETQLVMIREGLRPVPAMQGMLDKLSDADLTSFSNYFSQLPSHKPAKPSNEEASARGKSLAQAALCTSCHLPTQHGQSQIPRLAGQREDFLIQSMTQFRNGQAPGRDTAMQNAMRGMSDQQISDLAHYLTHLP